jgi:hypothetical protein
VRLHIGLKQLIAFCAGEERSFLKAPADHYGRVGGRSLPPDVLEKQRVLAQTALEPIALPIRELRLGGTRLD